MNINSNAISKPRAKIFIYCLSAAMLCMAGYFTFEKYSNRNKIITELDGISIDDSLKDVNFKKGLFERSTPKIISLLEESLKRDNLSPQKKDEYKKLLESKKEQLTKEELQKSYDYEMDNISVTIEDSKVKVIAHSCTEYDTFNGVNGIKCNSSSEDILKKYGGKIRILCQKEKTNDSDLFRAYDSIDHGVRYLLKKDSVFMFAVAKPEILKGFVNINWAKCD